MNAKTTVRGKVWVFGDSIDTDAMYPAFAMKLDVPEAAAHVFHQLRPGWTDCGCTRAGRAWISTRPQAAACEATDS